MSMTTEQIKKLKDEADLVECTHDYTAKLLREAADTIKVQSAKIHAYAMERSTAYYNGGWIPVTERLPEKDTEYLITRAGSLGMSIVDIASWYRYEKKNHGFCKANMVTAWMPLPEAYREDNENV